METVTKNTYKDLAQALVELGAKYGSGFKDKLTSGRITEPSALEEITREFCHKRLNVISHFDYSEVKEMYTELKKYNGEEENLDCARQLLVQHAGQLPGQNGNSTINFFKTHEDKIGLRTLIDSMLNKKEEHNRSSDGYPYETIIFAAARELGYKINEIKERLHNLALTVYGPIVLDLYKKEGEKEGSRQIGAALIEKNPELSYKFYEVACDDSGMQKAKEKMVAATSIAKTKAFLEEHACRNRETPVKDSGLEEFLIKENPNLEQFRDVLKEFA